MTTPGQSRQDAAEMAAAALLRLAEVTEQIATLGQRLEAVENALAALAEEDGGSRGHRPAPAPRWWLLEGAEREAALVPVRAWVDEIYRPCYGHLAARLPTCWEQHPPCLFTLDWLSQLWQVLYLRARRSAGVLASQAEWQERLLPAAAEQMRAEATGCTHRQAAAS